MKVLVFNVKYSENLGDGILAQCLERELSQRGRISVETIDLAGRKDFGERHGDRRLLLGMLARLPKATRRAAVKGALGRLLPRLKADWRQRMAGADAIVIGGGNLFQDDDLNFPLKIAAVLDCACEAGVPVAIHAVGVSRDWSHEADRLFGRLPWNRLKQISVRDAGARANWLHHFGDRQRVDVCPDPGLLARDLIAAENRQTEAGPVAVCVTHPLVLARHASLPCSQIPFLSAAHYEALATALVANGHEVLLFTNGACEDQRFLDGVMARKGCAMLAAKGAVRAASRPALPEELVALIAGASAVVAHRLHACIVAYSLARPHVGLGWDMKVESFFESVGRTRYFLRGAETNVERTVALVTGAIAEGIDPEAHARHLAGAKLAVARLADQFYKTAGVSIPL